MGKHLRTLKVMEITKAVRSLSMVKDFSNYISLLNIHSIHKAAVFNAEQLILGMTALRHVESLWLKGKLFPFLTSSNSIIFRTFFLRCVDLCVMHIGISFDARTTSEEKC